METLNARSSKEHTDWAATWWRSHFLGAHQTFLVSSSLDAHQDAHLCIQIPLALMGGWICNPNLDPNPNINTNTNRRRDVVLHLR